MIIMVHQQYWSSRNNDAATDAIHSAYIILQSDIHSSSSTTPTNGMQCMDAISQSKLKYSECIVGGESEMEG